MFGTNPTRSVERTPGALAIQEIFLTLQGEGPLSGERAIFIRLAGCHLACYFCDTEFESKANNYLSIAHIIKSVDFTAAMDLRQRKLVVLTGGEPLRQNVILLIRDLLASGTAVIQIETSGTLWPFEEQDDEEMCSYCRSGQVLLVCSPKTAKVHPRVEEHCCHWKYLIADGEVDGSDGLPNRGTQLANKDKTQRLYRPLMASASSTQIWVSPRDDYSEEQNERNWKAAVAMALTYGYRLSLQIHKLVGLK